VQSLGFVGGIAGAFKTLAGGEIDNLTQLISEGRHNAITRIEHEANERGAQGLTGVTLEVKWLGGMVEFLAIGSALFKPDQRGTMFSTACSGQDLYCQIDAGYEPRHLCFGNVAYALGIGRGISGAVRVVTTRGEIKEFSDMYNHTRHLALARLEHDARERGCNAVVDVMTRVMPVGGAREILMVGSGSHSAALGERDRPVTSELTGEELWNLTQMGYEPLRLVLGSSVYALGIVGGLRAMFTALGRGEVTDMTQLVYEARENCLDHIRSDAEDNRADAVIGTKLFVNELGGGLIEVLAIGTAVRKNPSLRTHSEQLLPQAFIRDRDTFFDETIGSLGRDRSDSRPPQVQASPVGCLVALIFVSMFLMLPCLIAVVVAIANR
jgi:uncharacterized protein YbjQ (UPF0145 family)